MRLQEIPTSPGSSFYTGSFATPDFNWPYCFHPEFEIFLLRRGHCTVAIADHAAQIAKGDLVVIGSNTPHFLHNKPGDSRGGHWAQSTIAICKPAFLGQTFWNSPEMEGVRVFWERLEGGGAILRGARAKAPAALLTALPRASALECLIGFLQLLHTLAVIPHKCWQEVSDASPLPQSHHLDMSRLIRVFRFVRENYESDIALADVARIANMAATSFSRFFHRKTGKTFQLFLLETRLAEASIRLLSTKDSVSEICYDCGFGNLSNFNRYFKRKYGLTPTAYRNARDT
jgi:AraC-like DNA-binding protein